MLRHRTISRVSVDDVGSDFGSDTSVDPDALSTPFRPPRLRPILTHWRFIVMCIVVTTLSIGVHINSLQGQFVFDDWAAIEHNPDVLQHTSWSAMWEHDFWGKAMRDANSHRSYRPLTVLSFRLNHWIHGGLNSYAFKLTNVVLHAVVSLLVLLVVCSVHLHFSRQNAAMGKVSAYVDDQAFFKDHMTIFGSSNTVLLTACLFALHPVHTEAVSGAVVGRAELLSGGCVLAAILTWHNERTLWTLIWILVGLLCKESAIVIPILLVGLEAVNAIHRRSFSLFSLLARLCLLSLPVAGVFAWRVYISYDSKNTLLQSLWISDLNPLNNHIAREPLLTRVLSYSYLNVMYYLRLSFLPYPLSADYSLNCIPVVTSVWDVRAIAAVVVVVGVVLLLLLVLARGYRDVVRDVAFGVAFGLITFLPASQMFLTVATVVAERLLYLPSLGACTIIASILTRDPLIQPSRTGGTAPLSSLARAVRVVIVVVLLSLASSITWQRNTEWLTSETVFESAHRVCPSSVQVLMSLGRQARARGDVSTAEKRYSEALKIYPVMVESLLDLGVIYQDTGRVEEAKKLFARCRQANPTWVPCYVKHGQIALYQGDLDTAATLLEEAVQRAPGHAETYFHVGNLYYLRKEYPQAVKSYMMSLRLVPHYKDALDNLAGVLKLMGRKKESLQYYQKLFQLDPKRQGLKGKIQALLKGI